MSRKKTNGIFIKGAQKGEKLSKNKVETVSVDTLYIKLIWMSYLKVIYIAGSMDAVSMEPAVSEDTFLF